MKADFRPSYDDYDEAFTLECGQSYPVVDAFEKVLGYAVDRTKLEEAARVLACPVKAHPPCWQHGRILYAVARRALSRTPPEPVTLLDIGTAKGFSALILRWALMDSYLAGDVVTVDVIAPWERVRRNSIFELDGEKTLPEFLSPWPEAQDGGICAMASTGVTYLEQYHGRLPVVFVDGKHSGAVVAREGQLIAERQQLGDAVLFDDVHLPEVAKAVETLAPHYDLEYVRILPHRAYRVGVRR